MINLKEFSREDLRSVVKDRGLKAYRADQIFQWLWQKAILEIDDMTNLSLKLREKIKNEFYVGSLKPLDRTVSLDSSIKYLFELEDGNTIESVFMPEKERKSVCVSVQVGCPLNCAFCATGKAGFERNLKPWEIVEQVVAIQRSEDVRITNVVFMGMGEPMLNLAAVFKACQILNSDFGPNIGARKMTISTAGIPAGIIRVTAFPQQLKLAISLNATTDEQRNKLMPINRKYPIRDVIKAIKEYQLKRNRMVTIEYLMIDGVNVSKMDARRLLALVDSLRCKINLIPYNKIDDSPYNTPPKEVIEKFQNLLYKSHKTVTIRKSRGFDVGAGCGQLRSIQSLVH